MLEWTCPSYTEWERYLVEKDIEDRPRLEEHLDTCPYCRFVVRQLKGELDAATRAWESAAASRSDHYTLVPIAAPGTENSVYLLAAQGDGKSEDPPAIALTTPDNKFLLRAVRDIHSGETWLYLAAEESGMERNVLIKPFGGAGEYVTDDQGRVNLGKINWPQPDHYTAEIHLPRATFVLVPPIDLPETGNAVELRSPVGDTIKLTFSGEGRNRRLVIDVVNLVDQASDSPLRIALRGPEMIGIMPVGTTTAPRVSFDRVQTEGRLEIYLYQ
jgi:hypothetical protein